MTISSERPDIIIIIISTLSSLSLHPCLVHHSPHHPLHTLFVHSNSLITHIEWHQGEKNQIGYVLSVGQITLGVEGAIYVLNAGQTDSGMRIQYYLNLSLLPFSFLYLHSSFLSLSLPLSLFLSLKSNKIKELYE